ncbi:MAG: metallophosphoesterase [Candidatus Asgardarchaeia archaeon]
MKVAVIGDLHLPYSEYYPPNYFQKIRESIEKERPDLLLLTGDLCWGKNIYEVLKNVKPIFTLRAKSKIAVPGNHDNWFNSRVKIKYFSDDKKLLVLDGDWFKTRTEKGVEIGIVGIMGWYDYSFSNAQVYPSPLDVMKVEKELKKLRFALERVRKSTIKIILMHYSPIKETVEGDPLISKAGSKKFFEIAMKYNVNYIFHSHTHTKVKRIFVEKEGVIVYNTSAVNLDFTPLYLRF